VAITVNPTTADPSHHISLSDGSTTIGLLVGNASGVGSFRPSIQAMRRVPYRRSSLRTASGESKYSDMEPPYSAIAQDNWLGGRGQENFERDKNAFYDNHNTWMMSEYQVTLAPQWSYGTGYRSQDISLPGSVTWTSLVTGSLNVVSTFTASATYAADRAQVWIRRVGTPTEVLTCQLLDASDSVLKSATVNTSVITDTVSVLHSFDWSTTQSLSSGTSYKVKLVSTAGTTANHWEIATTGGNPYYRVSDVVVPSNWKFFHYRQALYAVQVADDTTVAPKVWINGDRGAADSNSANKALLNDGTKSWTTNEWAGSVVKIVKGPGKGETRSISSNTGTALTVASAFFETHTTTTEYVILGSNKWTEIGSHGLTKAVTDIAPADDVCYFAQGDDTALRRMRQYNNSGTFTTEWAADGTNKAVFMHTFRDQINGYQVWRANNSDGDGNVSASRATAVAWGTNLTFGGAIRVGSNAAEATNMLDYDNMVFVFKEDGIYAINNDRPDKLSADFGTQMDTINGAAAGVHSPFLYLSFMFSLERLYGRTLDDVGPVKGSGMPTGRQGPITALLPIVKYIVASMDAGDSGTSSVLIYENGWSELMRAPETGVRIRSLAYQVVPDKVHKIWAGVGGDLVYMPYPGKTFNPYHDGDMTFQHEGYWITAWMAQGMVDLPKFFNELKIFSEKLASNIVVVVDYQKDDSQDSDAWTNLATFNTSPIQTQTIGSSDVTGRRIRFRFRLITNDNSITPRVTATVTEMVAKLPVKFQYATTFQIGRAMTDLNGDEDSQEPDTVESQLRTWAEGAQPLTMRTVDELTDNKTVFLDPASLNMTEFNAGETDTVRWLGNINILEA
jgi:hypothetical protein